MFKKNFNVKNDILYLFVLILITEFFYFVTNNIVVELSFLITVGVLGIFLIETWFIRVFSIYSGRKVSKYSDVIVKISVKDRFFSYFILPVIFYISILLFLYFNKNILLGHFVLGVSMVLMLVLFLNVKSSLNKIYSLGNATKAIFDFICITTFYLLLNVVLRLGPSLEMFLISSLGASVILSLSVLKVHDRLGVAELIVSVLSSLFVCVSLVFFWNSNVFLIPAVGALAFYLVISLWNIRFSGKNHFLDYLAPFLYVVISLILILNI